MATRTEYDALTGETVEIELTEAELAEIAYQAELIADQQAEAEAVKAALEAKKQEVLAKLGLTADEVTALLA